jgi:(p)ppGpp synthase/HD superfamily hydrolase
MSSNSNLDKVKIEETLEFASKTHIDDFRDSGVPYSSHFFQVGYIIADWDIGQKPVEIGILHDCIEHSKEKHAMMNSIYQNFGIEVLIGVSGLSGDFKKIEDSTIRNAELYKRLHDFGSIFKLNYLDYVKVADGITNLYTKGSMHGKDGLSAKERQEHFCNTAKEHLIPIAKRLDQASKIEIELVPYLNDLIKR